MSGGLQLRAFRPLAPTVLLSVTTSSVASQLNYPGSSTQGPTPEYQQPQIGGGVQAIEFKNLGSSTVYVQFGKTTSRSGGPNNPAEAPTATIPTVGTPGSFPIPAGTVLVYSIGSRIDSIAVIASVANANFFYTLGEGT
jgi:hypothetical protein